MTADGRFMCRHPGCHITFRCDGKHRQQHEATHSLAFNETFNSEAANQREDDMYNYQVSLMEYGMIIKNFYDAVSEGDGGRVFLYWKFMLLYLKNDGTRSKKYALEAFCMMCQFYCLLSERGAHRLIWNRFIKNFGGLGGNIPLDLGLEHLNRLLKNVLRTLVPNATNHYAVGRYCKALVTTKKLIEQWYKTGAYIRHSGKHVAHQATNDIKKVVKELMDNRAMKFTKGRQYHHYRSIKHSLIADFDMTAMFKWINEHKRLVHLNKIA